MLHDLIRLALALAVGGALTVGYLTFRIWDQGGRDEARRADASVVLGAAQYNGWPSPLFEARLCQHLLKALKNNDVRTEKVEAIKVQIEAGTYEDDAKMDAAVDRMLDDLLK